MGKYANEMKAKMAGTMTVEEHMAVMEEAEVDVDALAVAELEIEKEMEDWGEWEDEMTEKEKIFEYLNNLLHNDGVVIMAEAEQHIQKEFGLSEQDTEAVLVYWLGTPSARKEE